MLSPARLWTAALSLLAFGAVARAQLPEPAQPAASSLRLTFADALDRARKNSVLYQSAVTDALVAHEDHKQAVAALLPSVNYNNSAIYTEGTGVDNQPKFIASNAIHEYVSQANVHESLSAVGFAEARRATAIAAAAKARAEVFSRGLVVTVVQAYYRVAATEQKLEAAQRAADEGARFLQITQDLERGGEVAHSDVVKAELQVNDRRRQLQEAKLARLNARLDLAVLIFPNFNDNYEIAEDLHAPVDLPVESEVQARAARDNPDLRAALEAVRAAGHGVSAARAAYLPSLDLDYLYGIDATRFATKTNGVSNLGSAYMATLNIPVWNWGATQSKVRQAELNRDQAQREMSFAQRKLVSELESLYAEAQTAASELSSLQRSAALSAESLRLINLRYRNGESSVLEVVDAQNTATSADAAFQDGAVRYRVALANLQTLTGVLTTTP